MKMTQERTRKSEDRRVKRTRRILRESLFSLLEQKTKDEITVRELTELADVNRSTFYFYYKDIDDMILQIQDEIYEIFDAEVIAPAGEFSEEQDFSAYVARFLRFCLDHSEICKFVIGNDPNNNLTHKVKSALLEHVPDTKKVFPVNDPKCYLTTYAVSAIWEIVIEWMYDGMVIPPEEMAQFVTKVYFYGGRTVLLE